MVTIIETQVKLQNDQGHGQKKPMLTVVRKGEIASNQLTYCIFSIKHYTFTHSATPNVKLLFLPAMQGQRSSRKSHPVHAVAEEALNAKDKTEI